MNAHDVPVRELSPVKFLLRWHFHLALQKTMRWGFHWIDSEYGMFILSYYSAQPAVIMSDFLT